VLAALLAVAGVAQAAGVFQGGHKDPAADAAEAKSDRLEAKFEAEAQQPQAASARPGRRGPRGSRGPRGPKGAKGATGPKGTFGSVLSYASAGIVLAPYGSPGAVGSTRVECPPGTLLTGGGYIGAGILTTVTWSASVGNAWGIIAVNLDETFVTGLKAVAQCATP
jgi:hypothetical protein